MPAKAEIYGLRTHDNRLSIWFDVLPERVQAYAFPGKDCLHVVFGGRNIGDVDGDLWGRLMNFETGLPIIPKKKYWCAVGDYVWWEKTFDMPTHNLMLSAEVGSNEGIDERHIFTVYAGEPPFDYTWKWVGKSEKTTFSWKEHFDGTFISGSPPPSDAELIEAAKSVYYGVVFGEFRRECAKQDIPVDVTDIVTSAWVDRGEVKKRVVFPHVPEYSCKQDVTVRYGGKVYFNSSQDLAGTPISPTLIIALGAIIAIIILAFKADDILRVFVGRTTTEESKLEKRNAITVGEEGWTTTADITLPDDTVIPAGTYFPPGTTIEWTTIEEHKKKEEEPALGAMALIGLLLIAALMAPKVVREVRKRRED